MKQEWEAYWDNYRFPEHFMQSDIEPYGNPVRLMIAKMTKARTILDVGCGSCINYPLFKDRGYVGVDFTLQFLKVGKRNGADVVGGYVLQLPFKDEAFDTVIIKDVLEHLGPDAYKTVIAEMWRVARWSIIIVFYGDLGRPTKYEQLREPDEHNEGVPPYKGGTYYFNRYSENDVIDVISQLPYRDSYDIIEHVPRENCPEDKIGRTVVHVVKQ